jgi:hypothetical protein
MAQENMHIINIIIKYKKERAFTNCVLWNIITRICSAVQIQCWPRMAASFHIQFAAVHLVTEYTLEIEMCSKWHLDKQCNAWDLVFSQRWWWSSTFICPCVASISLKYNQQDATFSQSIYFYKLLYMFQAGSSAHHQEHKNVHRVSGIVKPILLPASISSTIAVGSSIGLTIPDAVCTVLCSWWWAEEPPETCRAIYRNK